MDYQKDTLKNGLRVLIAPMPQVKSVTAMIVAGVGSRFEERERQGISHFTEHMMFKGTKRRPTALAIASELEGIGADFNAFTGEELTGFYVKAAAKHLPLALDVLSDILLNSKFEEKEIAREKGVILEERRMYRDNPREHIGDLYNKLVFGEHPLGWETVGREETIKAMSRKDLLDYTSRWFKPGNTVVVVTGDTDGEKALAEVRRRLGKLQPAKLSKPLPFKARQGKPEILIEERKTDQTHLALGVRGYPLGHPKKYACAVLNTILGEGMSSRLFLQLREKMGLAYYVGSLTAPYTDTGTLVTFAGVNNQKTGKAVEAIIRELKRLKDKPVPSKEISKAKEMIKGELVLSLESSSFVARFLVGQEVLERKIETPEELMRKIDVVTAQEVQDVAQELFTTEGLNLALIGPVKGEKQLLPLLDLT